MPAACVFGIPAVEGPCSCADASLWLQESESEEEAAALVAAKPREPPRWVHGSCIPVPLPAVALQLQAWDGLCASPPNAVCMFVRGGTLTPAPCTACTACLAPACRWVANVHHFEQLNDLPQERNLSHQLNNLRLISSAVAETSGDYSLLQCCGSLEGLLSQLDLQELSSRAAQQEKEHLQVGGVGGAFGRGWAAAAGRDCVRFISMLLCWGALLIRPFARSWKCHPLLHTCRCCCRPGCAALCRPCTRAPPMSRPTSCTS